jgi:endoglucanase
MKDLLKKLSEAHGAPGHEEAIAKIVESELKKVCDEIYPDKLGNLIAKKGSGKPVYMLTAHMDEIGFMVNHIDKNGFVKFVLMGGFYDPSIFGTKVLIHTEQGDVPGVVGGKPVHIMEEEERQKVIKWKELFIDIGAESREDAEKLGISIGNPVTFDQRCEFLIKGNKVSGKAMDDRAGLVTLIETMKRLKKFKGTVYLVGTVQEEVGLKGAQVSAYRLNPDIALAIDVTFAGDQPSVKEEESPIKLNKGPAIICAEYMGRGLIANPKINKWLIETAKANKIPYQLEATFAGMTDAATIYVTKEGIPSGSIGIPTRYIHTPVETIDMDDIENTVKLLVAAIEKGIDI